VEGKQMKRLFLPLVLFALAVPALADVVYDSLPTPQPSVVSECYECSGTGEIGQGVVLQGNAGATLTSATVLMENWAMESTYETVGTSAGYVVPLTLNLYDVGTGVNVGPLISTETVDALIQWQPEFSTSAACQALDNQFGYANQAWATTNGTCYFGDAQTVTFNLANIAVPSQFVWGLALNTQTYGTAPTGVAGPYNSLNIGLNNNPDNVSPFVPSVGSDLAPGSIYWNSLYELTNPNLAPPGTFQQDSNWAPYDPAISFSGVSGSGNATPEPSFLLLVGLGFAGLFVVRWKFRGKSA
jgi:hypothetical protein